MVDEHEQPSAVAPDPVSDTGDRPADYAVLDWSELAWEAGENPHIDVSRLVMAGEAMRRYFEQRLAALEAENATARRSGGLDRLVERLVWRFMDVPSNLEQRRLDPSDAKEARRIAQAYRQQPSPSQAEEP